VRHRYLKPRRFWRYSGFAGGLTLWLVMAPLSASAQTGQTAQIPLQFDFLNPGARSLGLGSAFIAVADDATSAFTNPAGLTLLPKPEASLELRYRRLDTPYLTGGRLSGAVTNAGIDRIAGPSYDLSRDSAFRPYYFSFVYPIRRLSLAAYRHELALQTNSFLSQGPFQQIQIAGSPVSIRNAGLAADRDIKLDNYGAAVSYRASEHLSLGLGLSVYQFRIDSSFGTLGRTNVLDIFSPSDIATRGAGPTTTQDGSDTKAAVNVGALVTANRKFRVGFVYRQGTSFDFEQVNTIPGNSPVRRSGHFQTPNVFGAGARIQPTERLSFAVDYDRVEYSRLKTDFIAFQVDPTVISSVSVPDANEVHIGGEYTFAGARAKPSIRAGLWYDPKHSVEYNSQGITGSQDEFLRAVFPGGKDVWHYCAGLGVPVSSAFEFNVGTDLTKERKYVSASVVVRFGK
jgi:long-chain fatty acid transport protein